MGGGDPQGLISLDHSPVVHPSALGSERPTKGRAASLSAVAKAFAALI